ncbi:MAG: copper resistance D family protein, partial [Candidatus Rokuibacteriota bacterium]
PGPRALSRLLMALALVAEAGSGHSASAGIPTLATASFAVHLAAAGVWVFAILAAALSAEGVVTALAAFSPYAIGAAVLVGASGLANTALELTRPADLWSTGYGWAVVAKAAVFLAMACLGLAHHRRRRRPGAQRCTVERPLRLELGVAGLALGLATVLVSFPNPPREAGPAEPVTGIDPVLASLGTREALSVAAPSGPFIVGLTLLPPRPGTVEVRLQIVGLEAGDAPRHARGRGRSDAGGFFEVSLAPCEKGFGCFTGLARIDGPGVWRVETSVTSNRGPIAAEARLTLPAADGSAELARAIEAMEGLRSARLLEELRESVGAPLVVVRYRFRAPDAFEMRVKERQQIVIGEDSFFRLDPSDPWMAGPWPRPGFTWPKNYYREFWRQAAAAHLLGVERVGGIPSNVLAFVRPELPAWFRLWVGVPDGLVHRQEMLAQGHIMEHAYIGLNEPLDLRAPR